MPRTAETSDDLELERAGLAADFARVRSASVALCDPLRTEDYVVQSMPDVSPTKWHLAHTTWFFETFVLLPHCPGHTVFDERFNFLFNSYYNSVGEMHPRPQRGLITRPSVERVFEYRDHIDRRIVDWLEDSSRDISRETLSVLRLGLHHEQQHQELMLMDIKHVFSCNPLLPAYRTREPDAGGADRSSGDRLAFEGGVDEIGHAGGGFAFDNEGPRHRTFLEPFEIADRCVTNAEYSEFVEDGGYGRPELWLSDGWEEIVRRDWQAPLYWRRAEEGWHEFTLGGARTLSPREPVCHVSYYEADAFARWAGARLPTEQEWEIAAADPKPSGNFVESKRLHPAPAGDGSHQFFGDVWEWTASAYAAYPGYRPAGGALGEYNGKFMCNQIVLRGGCCATPRNHVRRTYRNFFYPHMRWQFGGIRLAWDRR